MRKFDKIMALVIGGAILFAYPKPFKETYEDVGIYKDGNKVSTIDIKLDARVHKSNFVLERLMFSEKLGGTITLGDEKYKLSAHDLYMFPDEYGNYTDNGIYRCSLYDDTHNGASDEQITLDITHDKSKMYIEVSNNIEISDKETIKDSNADQVYESVLEKELIYPSNSDEDYENVLEIMDRNNNI